MRKNSMRISKCSFYRPELLVFVLAPSISAPAAALHLHDAASTALALPDGYKLLHCCAFSVFN